MGQAGTVASQPIAVGAIVLVRAKLVALALLAGLRHGVAKIPRLAVLTLVPLCVADALEALARAGIAVARVHLVPVVTAVALDT